MKKNIDFEKLGEIMDWERFDGETWEDVFMREVGDTTAVPDNLIIDVVHAGGLEKWARLQKHTSVEDLAEDISRIMRKAINSSILTGKKKDTFPAIRNFSAVS